MPRVIAGCVLSIALASGACAEVVSVLDTEFLDSNWTVYERPYGDGGGSGIGAQILDGGVGDSACRWVQNTAGWGLSGVYNAHVYTGLTYIPALSGPLTELAMSFDSKHRSQGAAVGFAVVQDGTVWFSNYWVNSESWQTFTFNSAEAWYQINPDGALYGAGPDFSGAGAPMQFGFLSGNGATSVGYSATSVYDNFSLSFVPAPGAAGLMAFATMLGSRRRRRN